MGLSHYIKHFYYYFDMEIFIQFIIYVFIFCRNLIRPYLKSIRFQSRNLGICILFYLTPIQRKPNKITSGNSNILQFTVEQFCSQFNYDHNININNSVYHYSNNYNMPEGVIEFQEFHEDTLEKELIFDNDEDN